MSKRNRGQVNPKRKRSYNTSLIKSGRSYTVQQIAERYGLCTNAVHRWIKAGLTCIDDQKPQRVHGSELVTFLKARQTGRKRPCKPAEIYCCKCRAPRPIWGNTADLVIRNAKQLSITGLCEECGTVIFKAGSVKKLPEYRKIYNVQTIQGEHLLACANPLVMCDLERSL